MGAGVFVYTGPGLAAYGFGEGHPFGPDRHDVFVSELEGSGIAGRVTLEPPEVADEADLATFHTAAYIDKVKRQSIDGTGYLDGGDTPARVGIYESACTVVGTTLAAAGALMENRCNRAFVPIAGLHHAARNTAAGFCVFNDCAIAAEVLRSRYGLKKVAYVDIDAHHGDGVFYGFEDDPDMLFADLHEDGRFLYPGTGFSHETGTGRAAGTKLNIEMPPLAGDREFFAAFARVEEYLEQTRPEFILFQCGADSLRGDPITHLAYSEEAHAGAAAILCRLADKHCGGRILAMGGGGYNRKNLARAWTRVVQSFVES